MLCLVSCLTKDTFPLLMSYMVSFKSLRFLCVRTLGRPTPTSLKRKFRKKLWHTLGSDILLYGWVTMPALTFSWHKSKVSALHSSNRTFLHVMSALMVSQQWAGGWQCLWLCVCPLRSVCGERRADDPQWGHCGSWPSSGKHPGCNLVIL